MKALDYKKRQNINTSSYYTPTKDGVLSIASGSSSSNNLEVNIKIGGYNGLFYFGNGAIIPIEAGTAIKVNKNYAYFIPYKD